MPGFPVFVKRGDFRSEVDDLIRDSELTPDEAGLQKYFYVTQGNQTVVMVTTRESPLALILRSRPGWLEPIEES